MDKLRQYKKEQVAGLIIMVFPIILFFLLLNILDNEYIFHFLFIGLFVVGLAIVGMFFIIISRINYLKLKKKLINEGKLIEKKKTRVWSIIYSSLAILAVVLFFTYLSADFKKNKEELKERNRINTERGREDACRYEKWLDSNHEC